MKRILTFYQITDLHFYAAQSLGACGPEWERRAKYDQKCVAESEAIIDCAFEKLIADRETEIVLISGDLVCDGEKAGHLELKKKLDRLAAGGKRVFVLTATHDIHPEPKGYSAERGEYITDGLSKPELLELYWDFGPGMRYPSMRRAFPMYRALQRAIGSLCSTMMETALKTTFMAIATRR